MAKIVSLISFGTVSKLFFAAPMVGAVGKRIPVQLMEAVLLALALSRIWKSATHFHIQGTVLAASLIYIGIVKQILMPFKAERKDFLFVVILILLGLTIFYRLTKRNIISDIKASYCFLISLIKYPQDRKTLMVRLSKSWYNYKVGIAWKLRLFVKILRRINVYFSHKDSKYY